VHVDQLKKFKEDDMEDETESKDDMGKKSSISNAAVAAAPRRSSHVSRTRTGSIFNLDAKYANLGDLEK